MNIQTYPIVKTTDDILPALIKIIQLRQIQDVPTINNIPKIFLPGRFGTRIPSSSTDLTATDRRGDIICDTAYCYTLVDIGSTAVNLKWDRRSLNVSW